MKDQTFTGVGCFAKGDRLCRIFSNSLQTYTLGPFKEDQLINRSMSNNSEEAVLLQALVAGLTESRGSVDSESVNFKRPKKITGFYLTLVDQKLNLSIFARENKSRSEIFRTNLDELTELRRKRLN